MADIRVFTGGNSPQHVLAGEMAERIKEVVYEYSDRVSLAAAIGVLAIVQGEIMNDQG